MAAEPLSGVNHRAGDLMTVPAGATLVTLALTVGRQAHSRRRIAAEPVSDVRTTAAANNA